MSIRVRIDGRAVLVRQIEAGFVDRVPNQVIGINMNQIRRREIDLSTRADVWNDRCECLPPSTIGLDGATARQVSSQINVTY